MTRRAAWPPSLAPEVLDGIHRDGPFLAIDRTVVRERSQELRDRIPGLELFYAVKCNSSALILEELHDSGCGFEVASRFELDMVTEAGADPSRVLYSNPVKPISHIEAAFRQGVDRFAFDSEAELRKIAAAAPGARVYVRLRVGDDHSLFPLSKKFGTATGQAGSLLSLARHLGLEPYGVTFHVGSQCTDPAAWRHALDRCGAVMRDLRDRGIELEMVDLGGGFPARYVDPVPTVDEIAAAVAEGLAGLPYRPRLLCAEPGRYLVAEAGVLATTVIGVEERDGGPWAYLDVGAYNGLMEALQTGGRWLFPMATSRPDGDREPRRSFTLTGPSCDSSDTLFHGVPLPQGLAVGDRLYIGTAGAYTLSYASSFNGFPPPAPVFLDGRAAALSSR